MTIAVYVLGWKSLNSQYGMFPKIPNLKLEIKLSYRDDAR
jgi:hypothetical protein